MPAIRIAQTHTQTKRAVTVARRSLWLRALGVLISATMPLAALAQGGRQGMGMEIDPPDIIVDVGGSDLAAFCIDQGISPAGPNDVFLAASAGITVTRTLDGQTDTRALNEVLGQPGWVKIVGTGHADKVRAVPLVPAGTSARFTIHVPQDKPSFLTVGSYSGSRWVGTVEGAARGVAAAERAFAAGFGTIRDVNRFGARLRTLFGGDSQIVSLFESEAGVSPRTKINWHLKSASAEAAAKAAREQIVNFQLEVADRKGVSAAQAALVFGLAPDGSKAATVAEEDLDVYREAHVAYSSPVFATLFRQLVAREYVQNGKLQAAVEKARGQMLRSPVCQAYAQTLESLKEFPRLTATFEAEALQALEFRENLSLALRDAGFDLRAGALARQVSGMDSGALDELAERAYAVSKNLRKAMIYAQANATPVERG